MANVITVSALNRYVKSLLEEDGNLYDLALRGEIANFVRHYRSGHLYFTLRDENASVKAVMFRQNAQRLSFTPREGMRVVVRCRVSLYERDGAFQVYVTDLFPDGVGSVQMAFDQLKEKLAKEGLFLQEHKRPLPKVPACVGIVTSRTGAALQDVLNVAGRRWPLGRILLAPVNVQGEQAVDSMVAALAALARDGRPDVILIARGGGSREDLWVFNSEKLARAAYASPVPVVSAVGHEIDYTILDFVADLRAPTPSAAAELIFPDVRELEREIYIFSKNIQAIMQNRLEICYNELNTARQLCQQLSAERLCDARKARLDAVKPELKQVAQRVLEARVRQLGAAAALADGLSPYRVLARGYAMVENDAGRLARVEELKPGQRIRLKGHERYAACLVERIEQEGTNGEKSQEL
ncbi:MAG: exodeoxyribonuclease VII large subunit [Oscillospiraceae bacterium]|nr:exodeoxyribonuclease VII large subunit [Oscillospiraceae bacterium]